MEEALSYVLTRIWTLQTITVSFALFLSCQIQRSLGTTHSLSQLIEIGKKVIMATLQESTPVSCNDQDSIVGMQSYKDSAGSPMMLAQDQSNSLQSSDDPTVQVNLTDESEHKSQEVENEETTSNGGKITGNAKNINDSVSDNEAEYPSQLVKEAMGAHHIFVRTTLAQRRAKADRRLLQSKAYAELIEDRLMDLEHEVRKLSRKPLEKEELEKEEVDAGDDVPTILGVVTLAWSDFNPWIEVNIKEIKGEWKHSMELNQEPKCIIEILKDEPRFGSIRAGHSKADPSNQPVARGMNDGTAASVLQTQDASFEPYLIRIRSKLLLKILKEITDCDTTVGPFGHRLLLLRPFKLLIYFEGVIRQKLREVEKIHSRDDEGMETSRSEIPSID